MKPKIKPSQLIKALLGVFLFLVFIPRMEAQAQGQARIFLPLAQNGGGSSILQPPALSCQLPFAHQESDHAAFEAETLKLINEARAKVGAPPIQSTPSLEQLARFHSSDMANSNKFSHDGSGGENFGTRIDWGCDPYSRAGEIIGWNYQTPRDVVNGWLNSPPHKQIMLDAKFTHAGAGFASNENGLYWTVDFIAIP